MGRLPFKRGFQVAQCRNTLCFPRSSLQMCSGRSVWLPLVDRRCGRELFERALSLKPKRAPWSVVRRATSDARWFGLFLRISWYSACPSYTVGQMISPFTTATFAMSEGITGRRCCGHTCVREVLHWVKCKCNRVAVTTLNKELLCVLRYHVS